MALVEQLHALFLLDQQVRGLRTKLDAATRRLNVQRKRLEQFNQQLAELSDQVKVAQAKSSTLEHESKGVEERIEKLRAQMNAVKTNKEYSALLVEVNTLKADKGKVEDGALEELAKVDILVVERDAATGKVAEQEKLVAGAEADVKAAEAEVGEQLERVTAERDAAKQGIPQEAIDQFEWLLEAHDGEALAVVHEQNRRHMEYTCGGCFIGIPIQRLNALMVSGDELVTCPSCERILYLEDELKSSFAK